MVEPTSTSSGADSDVGAGAALGLQPGGCSLIPRQAVREQLRAGWRRSTAPPAVAGSSSRCAPPANAPRRWSGACGGLLCACTHTHTLSTRSAGTPARYMLRRDARPRLVPAGAGARGLGRVAERVGRAALRRQVPRGVRRWPVPAGLLSHASRAPASPCSRGSSCADARLGRLF